MPEVKIKSRTEVSMEISVTAADIIRLLKIDGYTFRDDCRTEVFFRYGCEDIDLDGEYLVVARQKYVEDKDS